MHQYSCVNYFGFVLLYPLALRAIPATVPDAFLVLSSLHGNKERTCSFTLGILAPAITLSWFQQQPGSGQDRSGRRMGAMRSEAKIDRIQPHPDAKSFWSSGAYMRTTFALNTRLWFVWICHTLYIHIKREWSVQTERAIHRYAVPNVIEALALLRILLAPNT